MRRRVTPTLINTGGGGGLLLDDYPNAAVAYSLRYLRSGYVGSPVIRVRRSNDNAEQDFTPDEITNGNLTTFTGANDGLVTTWYDQSLNVINATQSNIGLEPIIVSLGVLETINLNPSMRFTGTQYFDSLLGILSQPNHFFTVSEKSILTTGYLFDSINSASRNARGNAAWIFAGVVLNNAYPTNIFGQLLFSALFNTTSEAHLNGVLQVSGNAGTQGLNGLRIGAANNLGFSKHNGTFQEFIIYNTDQSANRIAIQDNINAYYSIY